MPRKALQSPTCDPSLRPYLIRCRVRLPRGWQLARRRRAVLRYEARVTGAGMAVPRWRRAAGRAGKGLRGAAGRAVESRGRAAGRAGEDRAAGQPIHALVRRLGDAAARVHVHLLWRVLRVVLHYGWLLREGWCRKHRRDGSWLVGVVVGRADVPFLLSPKEIEERTKDGQNGDAAYNAAHDGCYGCWFGRRCRGRYLRGRCASRRRFRRR